MPMGVYLGVLRYINVAEYVSWCPNGICPTLHVFNGKLGLIFKSNNMSKIPAPDRVSDKMDLFFIRRTI